MQFLSKPKNRWGWLRIGSWGYLAVKLVLFVWAAIEGITGDFYTFLIPLALILAAEFMEAAEAKRQLEESNHLEEKHAAEVRQSASLERFREQVAAMQRVTGAVHDVLGELDGGGKAEVIAILQAEGLLSQAGGVDLKGADFRGVKLGEASLAGIHLDGADFQQADLRKADLSGASLAGCTLRRARLDDATLVNADLSGANLRNTHLTRANLEGCAVSAEGLEQAIMIDTVGPDGVKRTNERGREYLRSKELEQVVGRL